SLLRLLAHLGDHRIAGYMRKETIDVDRTEALGDRDVLLRREVLVAEEHDAVFAEGVADLAEHLIRQRRREIDAADLRPDMSRRWHYPDVLISHAILPAAFCRGSL